MKVLVNLSILVVGYIQHLWRGMVLSLYNVIIHFCVKIFTFSLIPKKHDIPGISTAFIAREQQSSYSTTCLWCLTDPSSTLTAESLDQNVLTWNQKEIPFKLEVNLNIFPMFSIHTFHKCCRKESLSMQF